MRLALLTPILATLAITSGSLPARARATSPQESSAPQDEKKPAKLFSGVESVLDSLLTPELLELMRLSEPALVPGGSPIDVQATASSTGEKKPYDGGDVIGAPLPFSNPTMGAGLAGVLGYLFRVDAEDEETPASMVGLGAFYSENDSWGVGLGYKFHLEHDTWRVLVGGAEAQVNYDFFGIGNNAGDANRSIPIEQEVTGGTLEILRRVSEHTYFGGRALYGTTEVSLDPEDQAGSIGGVLDPDELDSNLSSLGVHFQRDTRDSAHYPRHGSVLDVSADFYDEAWGSDFDFQVAAIADNVYLSLGDKDVLALRGSARSTFGDAPFFALSMLGANNDIRGYVPGRYRDEALLAAQAEYRREISAHFGLVAFGGVGAVAPGLGDFNLDDALPGGGVGVRYTISSEHHINLRLDFAWGDDSDVIYFSLGEAF
jgi:hypothetical protein